MNRDILKGRWKQFAGRAKTTWGQLTDDDWLRIEGDAERLSGKLQERYGIGRDEAEKQIKNFLAGYDDTGTPRRDDTTLV